MKVWNNILNEKGSAVTAMMGGVAILAMLSFGTYQYMSGPLSSLSQITQKNIVDDQLLTISQIAALDAANLGDCDGDGYIEPREWRAPAGAPAPVNGGLLPPDMGAPLNDPWGAEYGYCVWDTGAVSADAACGGASAGRLDGADTAVAGEGQTLTVYAIISPGPDRTFQTTCNDYVDATTDLITSTGDDIIQRYTYREASTATSSLWNLKTGFPETAEIGKNLEIGSDINFDVGAGTIDALAVNTTGKVYAGGGLHLGDQIDIPDVTCTAMTTGLMRYNTSLSQAQVCSGAGGWVAMHSSGGALSFPLQAPDGSAAAPSYSFTGMTDAGMFLDAGGNAEIQSPFEMRLKAGANQIYLWDTEIYMELRGAPDFQVAGDTKITFTDSGSQPHYRLSVDGGIEVADTTDTCASALEGTLKYLAASDTYQFCNGTSWVGLPSVPGAPCLEDATNECNLNVTREVSDIDFLPENIRDGVNILGVTGTAEPIGDPEWDRGENSIIASANNSCAIMFDGSVRCVGYQVHGATGTAEQGSSSLDKMTNIYESGPWKSIDGFYQTHCGIKNDGTGWCWGSNTYNATATGASGTSVSLPLEIVGNSIWKHITASYLGACGVKEDGSGWCWGRGSDGQIGDGDTNDHDTPTSISGGHVWEKIETGWKFSCGITEDRNLYCWGIGSSGQLGIGSTPAVQSTPVEISGGGEWLDVSLGYQHACAIKSDHTAWCWGNQAMGRLGNGVGTSGTVPSPGLVVGGHNWRDIEAGHSSGCGITMANKLYCWGTASEGQLGNGSSSGTVSTPAEVSGGGEWLSIAAGFGAHKCAVKADSTLWCWGRGQYNKTGLNNSETEVNVPTKVTEYE